MPHAAAARTATRDEDAGRYQRHRPEQTLLYRIVEEYYPALAVHLAEQGRELPDYVHREFEDYLSGRDSSRCCLSFGNRESTKTFSPTCRNGLIGRDGVLKNRAEGRRLYPEGRKCPTV